MDPLTLRPPTYEDFERHLRAVDRVEALLKRTTDALDDAGLDYAVIGGNAVAAWISTIDRHAIRATKDVDLLIRRSDHDLIAAALRTIGLEPAEVSGVSMFLETEDPSPKNAVHVIFANEPIREFDSIVAPDVADAAPGVSGFRVIPLLGLVQMKLLAFRLRDQTHLVDMLSIGLLDASWKARLPQDLQDRFQQMLDAQEREGGHH